jgi:lipopolysaccharide/colanic/teichoic acid biosynthesis glycosyltransferase
LDSRGPVLFGHEREGKDGKGFRCWKFRTMIDRAHSQQRALYQENLVDGPQFKLVDDPRITRVGRILRATNIDELPQLLNVLKGNMSLIGPRPLPLGLRVEGRLCSDFPRYAARHRMRPGITGLAQIKGWRGGMDVRGKLEKRLEWDLEYIEQYSLALDARILLGTAVALLRPTNAY